jgi:hypothetical protein
MFIRPNFAFAVAWLGTVYSWDAYRRKEWAKVIALVLGLGLALWMPLHNWYYGHELYLISRAGAGISVPLGARDYASAIRDIAQGRHDTTAVTVTAAQLKGWLSGPGYVGIRNALTLAQTAHAVNLVALVVTCWVAFRWLVGGLRERDLGVITVAAIAAHLPMLFIFSTSDRYAMLGWDLSLIVLLVSLARWRVLAADAAAMVHFSSIDRMHPVAGTVKR